MDIGQMTIVAALFFSEQESNVFLLDNIKALLLLKHTNSDFERSPVCKFILN